MEKIDISQYDETEVKIVKFLYENQGNTIQLDIALKELNVSEKAFIKLHNSWQKMCNKLNNKVQKPKQLFLI